MALSRVKTWALNEVLTSADLNAEFTNILDNALSLISPLTGNLAFGGFRATGLSAGSVSSPSLQPTSDTNTGIYFSAADTVDIAAGGVRVASFPTVALGVNYLEINPGEAGVGPRLDAEGDDTDINIGYRTKGAGDHIFYRAGGSNEMGRFADDIFLWGTTLATGSAAGDITLANDNYIHWVNAAGTTSANFGITGNSSDSMLFAVPAADDVYGFTFAGNEYLRVLSENSGAGISFIGESSADHTAPAANGAIIYTKDNGAGKTQLMAIFATGAAQQLAIQP